MNRKHIPIDEIHIRGTADLVTALVACGAVAKSKANGKGVPTEWGDTVDFVRSGACYGFALLILLEREGRINYEKLFSEILRHYGPELASAFEIAWNASAVMINRHVEG